MSMMSMSRESERDSVAARSRYWSVVAARGLVVSGLAMAAPMANAHGYGAIPQTAPGLRKQSRRPSGKTCGKRRGGWLLALERDTEAATNTKELWRIDMSKSMSNALSSARFRSAIAACGIAVATMTLTAPVVAAEPQKENQIMNDCYGSGPTASYDSFVVDGVRYSSCCYRGTDGTTYCHFWENGEFKGQESWPARSPDAPRTKPDAVPPPVTDQGVGPRAPKPASPPPVVGAPQR